MTFRRNTGAYFVGLQKTTKGARSTAATATFATSPAGQHRALARKAFAIAKKARASGNVQHYRKMIAFGKRALALSKTEMALWKRGQALRAKSFAAHRAAKRSAAFR